MEFVIVLLLLTAVVLFVTVPLRNRRAAVAASGDPVAEAERAADADRQVSELDAARELKYREIRDAELDHSTGKLSDPDFQALDLALRGEAIEILKALDRARELQTQAAAQASGYGAAHTNEPSER
jgi:hypothetical protein